MARIFGAKIRMDGVFADRDPIVFYGVVRDQSGLPVGGAAIKARITRLSSPPTESVVVADASGRFEVRGQGANLHITVSKEGYAPVVGDWKLARSHQAFSYAADIGRGIHKADADRPVLFQLKKQEAHPLENLQHSKDVPRDGSPVECVLVPAKAANGRLRNGKTSDSG